MALDLHKGAQDFEQGYFYLAAGEPQLVAHTRTWLWRRSVWEMRTRDGAIGRFISTWVFGRLQLYRGDCKCAGGPTGLASYAGMTWEAPSGRDRPPRRHPDRECGDDRAGDS